MDTNNKAFRNMMENGICTNCRSGKIIRLKNTLLCKECGRKVSDVIDKENRLMWRYKSKEAKSIKFEIEKWNEWADKEKGNLDDYERVKSEWYKYEIYERNPPIKDRKQILGEIKDVKGLDILDIGGSCADSWRFLASGARSINQVEPALESQRLAIRRLDKALSSSDIDWKSKVLFHTTISEQIPFKESTFDMVFSRSSIHHTKRPKSIRECFRVLKPGGHFLIIEPLYGYFLKKLQILYRRVKNTERGSDKPLSYKDIEEIENKSRNVRILRYKIFNPIEVLIGKNLKTEFAYKVTNEKYSFYEPALEKSFIIARK